MREISEIVSSHFWIYDIFLPEASVSVASYTVAMLLERLRRYKVLGTDQILIVLLR